MSEPPGFLGARDHPVRFRRATRMVRRDPFEPGRAATPLELLFDLTIVVSFAQAASLFAHAMAEGTVGAGLISFGFAVFMVCWAWIGFTWFASAYDTDDWLFRVLTLVQMIGVVVLALGLPAMFHSVEHGEPVDSGVMLAGYLIMRLSMAAQWIRAGYHDASHRRSCLTHVGAIAVAAAGWTVMIALDLSLTATLAVAAGLIVVELTAPVVSEGSKPGTPWHANHLAERFGLLTIIALGEGVVGTVASLSALIEMRGWSFDAVMLVVVGMGLIFGMWWVYFIPNSGQLLRAHRGRVFGWAYGHVPLFASIVGVGAGLHAAAYYVEGASHLDQRATALSIILPVALFLLTMSGVTAYLGRGHGHLPVVAILTGFGLLLAAAVVTMAGAPLTVPLLLTLCCPYVVVVTDVVRSRPGTG